MPNHLKIAGPEHGVLCLTLHRPEALNTLNAALLAELATGLRFERHAFTLLAGTADREEGIRPSRKNAPPPSQGTDPRTITRTLTR